MRVLNDFVCISCGHSEEKLTDVDQVMCPECGGDATRMMGAPTVRLEGITGAFPGAHHRWAKIREDNARIKAARA